MTKRMRNRDLFDFVGERRLRLLRAPKRASTDALIEFKSDGRRERTLPEGSFQCDPLAGRCRVEDTLAHPNVSASRHRSSWLGWAAPDEDLAVCTLVPRTATTKRAREKRDPGSASSTCPISTG